MTNRPFIASCYALGKKLKTAASICFEHKKKKNTERDGGKADYLNERTDSALLSWGGFFSEV